MLTSVHGDWAPTCSLHGPMCPSPVPVMCPCADTASVPVLGRGPGGPLRSGDSGSNSAQLPTPGQLWEYEGLMPLQPRGLDGPAPGRTDVMPCEQELGVQPHPRHRVAPRGALPGPELPLLGALILSHRMRAAVPTHSHSQGPGKGTPPHPQTEGLHSRSCSPTPRPGVRAAGAQGRAQPCELTRRLFTRTGLRATRQPASEESGLGDNGKQPAF